MRTELQGFPTLKNIPALILCFWLTTVAQAELKHRYDFQVDANDQIGTADLTLNGTTISGGALVLPGGTHRTNNASAGGASLTELAGTINSANAVSMEAWFIQNAENNWSKIMMTGTDTNTYMDITPRRGDGTDGTSCSINDTAHGENNVNNLTALTNGTEYYLIAIWDEGSNSMSIVVIPVGNPAGEISATATMGGQDLALVSINQFYLGSAVGFGDPDFQGQIKEFRIYNHALEASEVSANYEAGPDVVPYESASNPDPNSGAEDVPLDVTLRWDANDDPDLAYHIVYLGTDEAAVEAATPQTPGIYQDTLDAAVTTYPPGSLQQNTDYYWRIDEVNDQQQTSKGPVWHFRTVNLKAFDPYPKDDAVGVSPAIKLSWIGSPDATGFDVYLGTEFDNLQSKAQNHQETQFDPGPLGYKTQYFWRIDTRYPGDIEETGDVWIFLTRDKFSSCLPGDLDGDCDVDNVDMYLFAQQWLHDVNCYGFDCPDFNEDGKVNLHDYFSLSENWLRSQNPQVIINEIHYHPDENTEPVEFIELYNADRRSVALDGWYFSDGITYTFPPDTYLEPDAYIVVALDPIAFNLKFGDTALGPYTGKLANEGENIVLRNAAGEIVDEVEYQDNFPWPVAAGGAGSSMELIHPSLDNNLGGSWRSSGSVNAQQIPATFLVPSESIDWHYFKGTTEPSDPSSAWRESDFVEDDNWFDGKTSIGFGDGDDNTILSDMQDHYTSIYLRHEFYITDLNDIPETLELRAYMDDGCVIWINGKEVKRYYVPDGELQHDDTANDHEAAWESYEIANPEYYLQLGKNILAIHALNRTLGSTDFSIDASLYSPGLDSGFVPALPSPGAINTNWAENSPPLIRQVQHNPPQPSSGTNTRITAKVTDPHGVAHVELQYQLVLPGQYIPSYFPVAHTTLSISPDTPPEPNPAYWDSGNWTSLIMKNDGIGEDEYAGDDIYTAVIPGQSHRVLVRYRIRIEDALGKWIIVPYVDDPSLNFAYFVYDGVPDYEGISATVLQSLPVYHLITRAADMHQVLGYDYADQIPQFLPGGYNPARFVYNWRGAFIYEGQVYDHIRYRLRGANGRYLGGNTKRSMRLRFNRGQYFQAKDFYGNQYSERWRTLTTAKGFDNRLTLTYALNEHINFFLYNALGVPSPDSHFFHFRVIDDTAEAPDPWRGDFWGINFAQETYDARFLDAHNLPEGNLYKLINSTQNAEKQKRYQALPAVTDGSDHNNIEYNLTGYSSAQYIQDHVRLDKWYAYHALCQAIRHYDYWPSANKNAAWYFEPDYTPGNNYLGKMWTLPFDTDATWGPTWNNGHDVVYNSIFPSDDGGSTPELQPDYYNAVREILDLLWQTDQVEPLVDYYADQIDEFVIADRIRWIGAPSDAGNYDGLSGAGKIGLANLVQDMKNFAFVGGSWPGGDVGAGGRKAFLESLAGTDDSLIPYTPSIDYYGATGYPINDLLFITSTFSDPQGNQTFGALKWRIAEVIDDANPIYGPGDPRKYEIEPIWEQINTVFQSAIIIPGSVVKPGHTYRVRIRMKDNTGRWSHWSDAIQFVAGTPMAHPLRDHLRVTEIMYHPAEGLDYPREEYEFIELHNTSGTHTLDLSHISFTKGIDFTFTQGLATSLPPGEYVLIVKNIAAFTSRYGAGLAGKIAGEYIGQLANGGEELQIVDYMQGEIQEFEYNDWYEITDGLGFSLVIRDPSSSDPDTWSRKSDWRSSFASGGSPGEDDSGVVLPANAVVINELLANSDTEVTDWIELHNTTGEPINLGGWFLSDDADDLKKYQIEQDLILPAYDYVVFYEDPNFGGLSDPGTNTPFAFNQTGDKAYLTSGSGGEITGVYSTEEGFGASEPDVAFGRYVKSELDGGVNFVAMSQNTPGSENIHPPKVGPIVINEIAYHPRSNGDAEYVELLNISDSAVVLSLADDPNASWRFVDDPEDPGLDYKFPKSSPVTLEAGKYLLLVKNLTAFTNVYGVPTGPNLQEVLVWSEVDSGSLSNGGEKLELQMPMPGNPGYFIRVDRVNYDDESPWPKEPDGPDGDGADDYVLERMDTAEYGNDVINWQADSPTPGRDNDT
jgi:lamin tail-like protein/concanavalin A-like lectin/glucanase superfamily protein/CotH protein